MPDWIAWAATVLALVFGAPYVIIGGWFMLVNAKKARRYAVTLKHNEGAFIALCVKKRWDRWTFEDVTITPKNPGGAYMAAAPGQLHIPYRNILYYQEIQETANATE